MIVDFEPLARTRGTSALRKPSETEGYPLTKPVPPVSDEELARVQRGALERYWNAVELADLARKAWKVGLAFSIGATERSRSVGS